MLEVDPDRPVLYLNARNLWPATSVSVFGVLPLLPGQASPLKRELCVLTPDVPSWVLELETNTAKAAFVDRALRFALVTDSTDVGTVVVEVRRDQDDGVAPDFERPIYQNIELKRAEVTDDIYLVQTVELKAKVPA